MYINLKGYNEPILKLAAKIHIFFKIRNHFNMFYNIFYSFSCIYGIFLVSLHKI